MFLKKLRNIFTKKTVQEVPICECVHYCGFSYGKKAVNPYEQYLRTLVEGGGPRRRTVFLDFLRYYRPRNMDEALAITRAAPAPLWFFPWQEPNSDSMSGGWVDDPYDVPDIITHFSEKGILEWRILEEFCWLERALYSIHRFGYQPETYNCFINLLPFIKKNGERRYLVLDGNHRISALSALGVKTCIATIQRPILSENVSSWPGVVSGFFSPCDALLLFNAYFNRAAAWRTTDVPAKIL